ncbi:GntR family transcriptional regulator [Nonomuraea sp. KM90]|uniref:GntR family transcriptional regulator n=1 Tax=Nonomuraea sp. KM90 TaxID=3457428 RepID=UPI003FCD7F69
MSIARQGRQPIWQQIADELRAQVVDGTFSAGEQLPTEVELTERYGVARNTIRQAMTALVNEGLVVPRPPRGYFVRDRRPMFYRPQAEFREQPASPEMDRFLMEHSTEGRSPRQTIDVAIEAPPAEVRKRLNLAPDELVVVRKRTRYLDDEPFHTNDSYYRLNLVKDTEIMRPEDVARGVNQVLSEIGYPQTRALDEIYIRMPTPDEARRLDLPPGTPIACHICTGLTDEGVPVRVVVNVLPGDRHVIVYERTKSNNGSDEDR